MQGRLIFSTLDNVLGSNPATPTAHKYSDYTGFAIEISIR
jgi:hypothetical protein